MNSPVRNLFSIFLLCVGFFIGMEPASVQAGSASSNRSTVSNASSVSFGWAKGMGGSSEDVGAAITVDTGGNVYTVGHFNGVVDFDPGPGVHSLTSAGFSDIFISKLDSHGNLIWVKRIGGTGYDFGFDLAVDASGNVYTTGYFDGVVDFDPAQGVSELRSAGWIDIFVCKLDSGGNFVWAKGMGGPSDDIGNAISVDASGNVYTTGYFRETADFNPGAGIHNLTSAGEYDIFANKLNSGGDFVWAKAMGGAGDDYGNAIAVDGSGNVVQTGYFFSTADFDPGAATYTLSSAGFSDIFISKLNSSGNFVWAKAMGGPLEDVGNSLGLDVGGNVYTTGYFVSTADFDPGEAVYERNSAGGLDLFVSKLDPGGSFVWAKSMGGSENEFGSAIALDASGNVYTTGYFLSEADFDPGESVYELSSAGDTDIFISKLDNSGKFAWANQMGGINDDVGKAIAVGASGNVYTTGSFFGVSDFDPGAGVVELTSSGEDDIFISKLVNPVSTTRKSIGVQDGWLLESTETSNQGGSTNSAAATFYLGDNAQKKQYRAILSFRTSSLPDSAVLTRITLKVKKQGVAGGGNPVDLFQGLILDVKKGFFGSAPGLQAGDFQGKANKSYGPFKPDLKNGWYTINLTPARAYINKYNTNGGVTQFRLRFKLDDNNNAVANLLKLYSGDAPAASHPQLIIEYYVP